MTWWLRVLVWAPVCFLLGLEVILSSSSRLPAIPGFSFAHADKVAHAGYFFLCGLTTVHAVHLWEGWSRWRTFFLILFGTALYGISDEIHQSFVPHRTPEVLDILADVTGAVLAAVTGPICLRWIGLGQFAARVLGSKKISSEGYEPSIP